jgi:hypothetical protein
VHGFKSVNLEKGDIAALKPRIPTRLGAESLPLYPICAGIRFEILAAGWCLDYDLATPLLGPPLESEHKVQGRGRADNLTGVTRCGALGRFEREHDFSGSTHL